jgi:hypothetical protein
MGAQLRRANQKRIPCNDLAGRGAAALEHAVEHAASYIGALEMGGLFCLPTADSLTSYLPSALREEVRRASLYYEPELRRWFEDTASEIVGGLR